MINRYKVGQNERLLVETGINHYAVKGPGYVWLRVGQRLLTTLNIGITSQFCQVNEVRTADNIPVEVTVRVVYRIDPDRFSEAIWPNIPKLNEGGWESVIKLHTEYLVRQLLADYGWQELGQPRVQERQERHLTQMLAERLERVGLEVKQVALVKTVLPDNLQRTLVRAAQNGVEARGRAEVLKEYFELFGDNLNRVMPYIVQWELMNMLHKNGNHHLLLAAANLTGSAALPETELPPAMFQMQLPVPEVQEEPMEE